MDQPAPLQRAGLHSVPERISLIWSAPDRIYAISAAESVGEHRVIEIANAIP